MRRDEEVQALRDRVAELEAQVEAAAKSNDAVRYMLRRIGESPDVAYYCGRMTEALHRLTSAYAAATGRDQKDVERETLAKIDSIPGEAEVVQLRRRVREMEDGATEADAAHMEARLRRAMPVLRAAGDCVWAIEHQRDDLRGAADEALVRQYRRAIGDRADLADALSDLSAAFEEGR